MLDRQVDDSRTSAALDRSGALGAPHAETVAPFLGPTEAAPGRSGRTPSSERTGPKGSARTPPMPSPPPIYALVSSFPQEWTGAGLTASTLLAPQALCGQSDDVGTLDEVHALPPTGRAL